MQRSVFKNIWMVDDDQDDILVFENVLKDLSPASLLTAFHSGFELLPCLAGTPPDLLFLDVNMPMMDGYECLRQIRASCPTSFPVILYSGSDQPSAVAAGYHSGATLFVSKPMTLQQLTQQLHALLHLNWDEPDAITQAHQVQGFVPFSAEGQL